MTVLPDQDVTYIAWRWSFLRYWMRRSVITSRSYLMNKTSQIELIYIFITLISLRWNLEVVYIYAYRNEDLHTKMLLKT